MNIPRDDRAIARGQGHWQRRVAPLPVRAAYTLSELARAASFTRRRLVRLLEHLGIHTMRSGSLILVPLVEIEEKAWPFWESIRLAAQLRHGEGPRRSCRDVDSLDVP